MKKIDPEKIFTPCIEEGRYFLVADTEAYERKNIFIIRTEKTQFNGRFKINRDKTYTSYYRIVYDLFSGFGAIRSHHEEPPLYPLRTLDSLKRLFTQRWINNTYHAHFYELTQDEVEKHVIMENI